MTFKYFELNEFACKHTGKNEIKPEFIHKLDALREARDFPFVITSGYRDITHPAEAKKSKGGVHTQGIAADIGVSNGVERATIIRNAIALGFNGIGVARGFIHVDIRLSPQVVWTY